MPNTLDLSSVLDSKGVSVAGGDGVVVAASPLSDVSAVGLVPRLGVQGAVGSLGNIVLAEDVGVEEVAGIVGAVGSGVVVVVLGVGLAGGGALLGVVDTGVVLGSHVRLRGLGGAAEGNGAGEVSVRRRRRIL